MGSNLLEEVEGRFSIDQVEFTTRATHQIGEPLRLKQTPQRRSHQTSVAGDVGRRTPVEWTVVFTVFSIMFHPAVDGDTPNGSRFRCRNTPAPLNFWP